MVPERIPGLGPRSEAPRLNPKADYAAARLTPQDGFVLSRVDGRTSIADICMITGLGDEATITTLQRLKATLIIVTSAPMAELPPGIAPASASRQAMSAAAGSKPATSVPAAAPAGAPAPAAPASGAARAVPRSTDGSAPVPDPSAFARPVALLPDAELDPAALADGPDLTPAARRRILSFHRQLAELDLFARLEVTAEAGRQEVRRSYFRLSKEFHPDRFYGKSVGRYKELLSDLFKAISSAFATLSNDTDRAAYVTQLASEGGGAPSPRPRFVAADTVSGYEPGSGGRGGDGAQ